MSLTNSELGMVATLIVYAALAILITVVVPGLIVFLLMSL